MKELWDVNKFPGPRTMNIKPVSGLEAALLADGVPKEKIYPIDVERALKKLDELKPHIRVYWKNGGHLQQVMSEREADLGYGMAGRIVQLAEKGLPLAWEWNEQMVTLDSFAILKGSKKKDAATKFIAFTADPKRQAAFAEWTYYGPANKKAYNFINKEKAMQLPTYPENLAKGFFLNDEWYAEHEQEVERMFDAWKMK
jgi:putative spermidine/putrescine transport system substrate-binding protein